MCIWNYADMTGVYAVWLQQKKIIFFEWNNKKNERKKMKLVATKNLKELTAFGAHPFHSKTKGLAAVHVPYKQRESIYLTQCRGMCNGNGWWTMRVGKMNRRAKQDVGHDGRRVQVHEKTEHLELERRQRVVAILRCIIFVIMIFRFLLRVRCYTSTTSVCVCAMHCRAIAHSISQCEYTQRTSLNIWTSQV